MKKAKSMLLSLTMILALGLIFQPTQVRAESGGPQNTSNSQSSGSSSPTLVQVISILLSIRW